MTQLSQTLRELAGKATSGAVSVGMKSGHNACYLCANGDDAIAQIYGIALHRSVDELGERDAEGLANAELIALMLTHRETILAALELQERLDAYEARCDIANAISNAITGQGDVDPFIDPEKWDHACAIADAAIAALKGTSQ